jgi:hypothetical protein
MGGSRILGNRHAEVAVQESPHDRSDELSDRDQPAEPVHPTNPPAPKQPAPKPVTSKHPALKDCGPNDSASNGEERPTLPDRPFDETDAAWGDYPQSSDEWLREQRPPHYE